VDISIGTGLTDYGGKNLYGNQNGGQYQHIDIGNRSVEDVAKRKCVGRALGDGNCVLLGTTG
jgi:hypothetical protein